MKYFLLCILILLIGALIYLGYWLINRHKFKLLDLINIPEFTIDEIEKHNSNDSLWVHYEGNVYDITKFISVHPGGTQVLRDIGGKNLKTLWTEKKVGWHLTNDNVLNTIEKYKIGIVKV